MNLFVRDGALVCLFQGHERVLPLWRPSHNLHIHSSFVHSMVSTLSIHHVIQTLIIQIWDDQDMFEYHTRQNMKLMARHRKLADIIKSP